MDQPAEPQPRELLQGRTLPGHIAASAHYEAGAVICQKYRLEAMLGEGGMSSVWRATNLQLDCPVAIKLIRAGLDRAELGLRLKLEARSAAKLAHPSIVRVFDVGDTETGDPFIVMELLSGETLSQVSFDCPLSSARAVQLLLPIAEALKVAHASGIVHRDLKPDNVFIVEDDGQTQPKLLDFGIAKLLSNADRVGGLTQSGTLLGTPEYMSPEGARGQADLDARADIWSFCVVLYEQVAGTMPFVGNNPYAVLRAIVEDHPMALPEHVAGGSQLWEILQRGLAKNPGDRFQSMTELGTALAHWLKAQGVQEDACGVSLDAKWLTSEGPLRPAVAGSSPAARGERHAAKKARFDFRPRRIWLLVLALPALALGGSWTRGGKARPSERTERPAIAVAAVAANISSAAPLVLPPTVVDVPRGAAAASVRRQAPVARRVPPLPDFRAPSPPAVSETRKDARSAPLDLIAPY